MSIPRDVINFIQTAPVESLLELLGMIRSELSKRVPFERVVIINESYHRIADRIREDFPFVKDVVIVSEGVYPIEEAYEIGIRAAREMDERSALVLSGHWYSQAVAVAGTLEKLPSKTQILYYDMAKGFYRLLVINKLEYEETWREAIETAPRIDTTKYTAVSPILMRPDWLETFRRDIGGEPFIVREEARIPLDAETVLTIAFETASIAKRNDLPIALVGPGIVPALAVAFAVGYGTDTEVVYFDMSAKRWLRDRLSHLQLKQDIGI